MLHLKSSNLVLIPNYFKLFYFKNNNLLVIKLESKKEVRCFKLPLSYSIIIFKNKIFFLTNYNLNNTIVNFKNVFIYINKYIFKTLMNTYGKLKIIGTGFKVFKLVYFLTEILVFKLGFSHLIYLQIQKNIKVFSIQYSELIISTNFTNDVISLINIIKNFKPINFYTGKGIFSYNQIICLRKKKSV